MSLETDGGIDWSHEGYRENMPPKSVLSLGYVVI